MRLVSEGMGLGYSKVMLNCTAQSVFSLINALATFVCYNSLYIFLDVVTLNKHYLSAG